jgi:hypothetical protein
MVRAILEGRKRVTRRPVKGVGLVWLDNFAPEYVADPDNNLCPYGKPGDRLWVRETTVEDCRGSISTTTYSADGAPSDLEWWYSRRSCPSIHMPRVVCRILLEVTDVRVERLQDISEEQSQAEGIIPVPKTMEDSHQFWRDYHLSGDGTFCVSTPKESFKSLWCHVAGGSFPKGEAAYKASPHSWDANPWVWVVEFKQVTP